MMTLYRSSRRIVKEFEIASAFFIFIINYYRYNSDLKVNYIGSSYCYDISYMLC